MRNARFNELVARTFELLDQHNMSRADMRHLSRPFVEYWIGQGKLPEEIVGLATTRQPDAHLGGIDA